MLEQASRDERQVGPYELVEEIGRGGAGVVWRARHQDSGALVALKSVHHGRLHHVSSLAREVRALQRIEHPGIVRILDFGQAGGRPWYAMELLRGRSLAIDLGRATGRTPGSATAARGSESTLRLHAEAPRGVTGGQPSWSQPAAPVGNLAVDEASLQRLYTLMRRLCSPLAFLHGEGMVHRDLKPSNVFVREDDTPVLMDFGLASERRDADGRERLEELSGIVGTVGYMSPERIRGEPEDARSDLYSLGCMLYEAVSGRPPFDGGSNAEVMDRHLLARPLPPSQGWPEGEAGLPPELDELILRLLAKDPADRPGHADEVAEILGRLGAEAWPERSLPVPRPYLYRPALAGREPELKALQHTLRRAEEGHGGLTVVAGASGIGKTALVRGLCRLAWHQGWQVITGECVPVVATPSAETRAAPLHPFTRLLGTAVDLCESDPTLVRDLFGDEGGFLLPYEPVLARLPGVSAPPEASTLPAEVAQARVLRALRHVVDGLSRRRPLLLVLDDLQWADPLSVSFLSAMRAAPTGPAATASERRRLVVLATLRPDEAGPELRKVTDGPETRVITLEPLNSAAVGKLVAAMMARPEPPPGLAELAWRESEGHPLLAGETVRTALEQGLLSRDGTGRWQVREGAEASLAGAHPQRLTALLERRLSGLSLDARRVMQMCAVLGREVPLPLLQALAERLGPESAGDLLDGITELTARQILEDRPGGRFRFHHDRLRELGYQSIPAGARPGLHRAAVDAYELRAAAGEAPGSELGTIAFHALAADDRERAMRYSAEAGELALSRAANVEAARLFRQALELSERPGAPVSTLHRARWERLAAEAVDGIGDLDGAKAHLQRAAALLGLPEPGSKGRMGLGLLWHLAVQLVRRLVREPRPIAGADLPRWHEAAIVYEILVHIHYYQSASLPLMHATFVGLTLAERCPRSPVLSSAYAYAYATLNVTPFRKPADTYLRLAEQALADRPDPAAESYTRLLQAVASMGHGNLPLVDSCVRTAMALSEPLRFRRRWEEAVAVLANSSHFHGESDAALSWSNQVIASARERGDGHTLSWGLAVRGATSLSMGLTDEALVDLAEALPLAEVVGRNETVWVLGLSAAARLRQGDRTGALDFSRRALQRIGSEPPVFCGAFDGYSYAVAVPLALAEAGDRTVIPEVRRGLKALAGFARIFPVALSRLELYRGRWLRVRGRRPAATRALERALAEARQRQVRPDEALAHLWLGSDATDPAIQRDHLDQALRLFDSCGLYHHAELLRRRGPSAMEQFVFPIESRV